jgi:hypothetical protein
MQHTPDVDVILAVLDGQDMVVYGRALLNHMVADGETTAVVIVRVPIERCDTADILEAYCAACPRVTMAEVDKVVSQIPAMERDIARDPHFWLGEP